MLPFTQCERKIQCNGQRINGIATTLRVCVLKCVWTPQMFEMNWILNGHFIWYLVARRFQHSTEENEEMYVWHGMAWLIYIADVAVCCCYRRIRSRRCRIRHRIQNERQTLYYYTHTQSLSEFSLASALPAYDFYENCCF